ncbi:HXXEE domain-containing protein, partial [Streptococcus sp. SPC0]|nr:HXXEE domain-containing protein [Streptococcus sp. SPC0]
YIISPWQMDRFHKVVNFVRIKK